MTTFRIAKHSTQGYNIVLILSDGNVVGCIYPDNNKPSGIKLISAHMKASEVPADFEAVVFEDPGTTSLPVPALHIEFRPENWTIQDVKIVRPGRN